MDFVQTASTLFRELGGLGKMIERLEWEIARGSEPLGQVLSSRARSNRGLALLECILRKGKSLLALSLIASGGIDPSADFFSEPAQDCSRWQLWDQLCSNQFRRIVGDAFTRVYLPFSPLQLFCHCLLSLSASSRKS